MAGAIAGLIETVLTGMLALSGVNYISHTQTVLPAAAIGANAAAQPVQRTEAMRIHIGKGEDRAELVFVTENGKVARLRGVSPRGIIWRLPANNEMRLR
jgi:hypothetical protein